MTDKKQQFEIKQAEPHAFVFGDPEPVLDNIVRSIGTFWGGEYYEPPFYLPGLSKMRTANAHHGSALVFRRNMLLNTYIPSPYFPISEFRKAATDYFTFGHAYLQKIYNYLGQVIRLKHVPALNMRATKTSKYIMLRTDEGLVDNIEFHANEIIHIMEYDTDQQIYGIPDWLPGMQSALLNEDATLFRRKYYKNGAHLGYIFFSTAASLDTKTQTTLQEKISKSKGVGNFRSMYIHVPNGKEKDIQILPVGDISQKDEFEKIKKITEADVLVAHRINPAMMGKAPENAGGFGDLEKITAYYILNEVRPAAQPWQSINEQLPAKMHLHFDFTIPNLFPNTKKEDKK